MMRDLDSTSDPRTDETRMTGSADPGRCAHRMRMWPALPLAFFLATGCTRLPTDAAGGRAARGAATASDLAPTAHVSDVIVQIEPGSDVDSVASAFNSQVLDVIPELSLALLRTPASLTASAFVGGLQSDSRVLFSESNAMVETAEAAQSTVAFCEATRTWSDVEDQTALTRVGAAEAQAYGRGEGALVAILDTGIDLDHPALAGVLDLPGIEVGAAGASGDDRPEGVDTNLDGIVDGSLGHGTHVAGIVHAVAPGARLLPVRVLDSDGIGRAFRVAQGIVAAMESGADVINLSLGLPSESRAIQAALDLARSAGIVVVAAAGNSDVSTLDFPAAYPPVLAVAGTDPDDRKAPFSDFGGDVDLAAPAVGILSTYWDGTYARWSGTSMASPFVAGTAALLYGRLGPRSPATAGLIEQLILAGAESLASSDPVYGGLLGAGRLSAAGSVARSLDNGGQEAEPRDRLPH